MPIPRSFDAGGDGLAGTKDIIEQHGGNIGVDGNVPRGSTFTVRIPLQPPAMPVAPESDRTLVA